MFRGRQPDTSRQRVFGGQVGRNLHTHPNAKVVGVFDERLDAWRGAHQVHQIHDFLEEGILIGYAMIPPGLLAATLPGSGEENAEIMALYNHMFPAACLVEDGDLAREQEEPRGGEPPVMRGNFVTSQEPASGTSAASER